MSEENVEAVKRGYEAWNADDLDAFLAELDPEIEVHPAIEPALEGGETTYRGFDGVRRAWADYRGGAWERLTVHVHEIRDLGESVLALTHIELTGRTTGIEFSQEIGQLITFRGGKAIRTQDFLSHAEALEGWAVGVARSSRQNPRFAVALGGLAASSAYLPGRASA